ncbi:MAG: Peptidyl-tRNA hydrolase [Dehalococcoidia bacterium]|nr:Peptidyl-tRNA hydrolase [Chloroflexota bacterium]
MKSIIDHLKICDFPRIRVGIGPVGVRANLFAPKPDESPQKMRSREYVLGHFTPDERAVLSEVCPRVAEAIYSIINEGTAAAMNRYNLG